MIKFSILDDGNTLRLSIFDEQEFAEFMEECEHPDSDDAFMEATETQWTNGWMVFPNADVLGQMSQCTVIATGNYEDDGGYTLYGKAYTNIHDYQTKSPLRELLEKGYYDFQLWEDFGNDGMKFGGW